MKANNHDAKEKSYFKMISSMKFEKSPMFSQL